MTENFIDIQLLSKKYKDSDFYAIKPLNLTIRESEVFGLLGPNGAGKTTLISMLCGLAKPTDGTVKIDGYSFKNEKKKIQKITGVVPQDIALYPTLTAYENLYYFGAMYGLKGADLKKKINKSLNDLGLIDFANKKVKTFSGGMKRRVNLLAGILHEPRILFLDEPTVGVDVQSKNVIIEHLKRLNQGGTTILYTSHHMVEAEEFCTRVAIVERGEVIIKGSPLELIKSTKNANRLEDVYLHLTGKELRDYV